MVDWIFSSLLPKSQRPEKLPEELLSAFAYDGIGGTAPLPLGIGPGSATSSGAVLGQPLGYAGGIGDVVPVDPTVELVSANGAWAGVGPWNLQVLANEQNIRGERFNAAVIEAMLDDDAAKPAFDSLRLSVLCGELKFEPSVKPVAASDDDGPAGQAKGDPKEARRAAEFCERQHARLPVPIPIWAWDYLEYLVYGHNCAEKVLEEIEEGPDAGLYGLRDLKIKGRWSYHLCTDPYFNMKAVYAQTVWGPAYIAKEHFLISSFGKRDSDPRGTSIYRAAKNPWQKKQRALQAKQLGDDQFGTPSVAFKNAPNAPKESQHINPQTGRPYSTNEWNNLCIQAWKNGSALSHDAEALLYVVESARDGSQLTNSVDYYDRCIVRSILLTAKGMLEPEHYTQGGGEHAQQKERGLADLIRDGLVADIRRQVFHYLLEVNWGKEYADLYTPEITLGMVPVAEFLKLASGLGLMFQSAAFTQSQWDHMLATTSNIPAPKPNELRIGPNGPVPNTLTAPAGSVETAEGKMKDYPPAPVPETGVAA